MDINVRRTKKSLLVSFDLPPLGNINLLITKSSEEDIKIDISCLLGKNNVFIKKEIVKEIFNFLKEIL
jgi:hypothetical protein